MDNGFKAVSEYCIGAEENDLGKLFSRSGKVFNENSPSSLGTILSFGFLGMAKSLKGSDSATAEELAAAMQSGLDMIMTRCGSKPGEKTILDSLCPAVECLSGSLSEGNVWAIAIKEAAAAAANGSEATKEMRSVHGRAAYYGDKSIGVLDGGSVVGRLIFEALAAL